MIRAGLIGLGYSARTFHLPFIEISDRFELAAISTSRPEVGRNRCPDVRIFASAEELIESADIDVVIITAPNAVHYELARQSLNRGLHVVLEKPMVTSSLHAESLAVLAKQKSRMLSVYQNRRWDGDFLTVSKLIAENAIGEVCYFESHFDRFRPIVQARWREQPGNGAGSWWDLGPHLVDQSLCLFGLPNALTARTLNVPDVNYLSLGKSDREWFSTYRRSIFDSINNNEITTIFDNVNQG